MPTVQHEVYINGPVEQVFAMVADADRAKEWSTNLVSIRRTSDGPGLGATTEAVMKIAGSEQRAKGRCTAYDPPSHIRLETAFEKGNKGRREIWLTPEGTGTRLRLEQEYSLPGGLFGKVLNAVVVERQVKSDIEESFSRLRALVESGRA
ncbi:MAG TPA: SRPBCC family protein [Chloroflexota bacterium]|nr:SRPBCC family protein [Chloroflexota bacterium]